MAFVTAIAPTRAPSKRVARTATPPPTTTTTTRPCVTAVAAASFVATPSRARLAGARARARVGTAARGRGATRRLLSMNLFSRFFRVLRSNLNALVSGMEDPEKVLNQSMDDMQKDLVRVRQAYAEVSASQKRLERQREAAEKTASEWYQRAQLALQKGDENLAREALVRRKQQEDMAKSLSEQLRGQAENTAKLYGSMQELEGKINEARAKKEQYVNRARTAKTSIKVNDMIGSVDTSGALAAFERMQQKVEQLEGSAEVSREMSGSADASLEGKFRALEAGDSVDDELGQMKSQLRGDGGGDGGRKQLESGTRASSSSYVDAEIERMRHEQQQRQQQQQQR